MGAGGLGQGVVLGGQGGREQRSEACVKIKKKWERGGDGGGQGGCEWRSEAFVKNQNIFIFFLGGGLGQGGSGGVRGGSGGVRVVGNEELKLL